MRLLLLLAPVRHDRRPGHAEPDHADVARGLRPRHLLVEDRLEAVGSAGAAVLLRPGQARVAALVEELAPLAAERVVVPLLAAAAAAALLGEVRLEPGAQLGSKGGLLRRVAEIHAHEPMPEAGADARAGACTISRRRTGSRRHDGDDDRDPDPLRPAQVAREDVDADEGGGDRERELAERGEERGRAAEAVVVEAEREEAGDEGEERDPEAVVRRSTKALSPTIGSAAALAIRPNAKRTVDTCWNSSLPGEIAAEHGAHAPEHGRAERLDDRRQPARVRSERVRERDQPDARERRQQEPGEARPRLLAEDEPRADDGDERLRLLQHEDGDEVAVEERLREEDRRDRRGAGADGDPGGDVARPGLPERAQRDGEQRQRQQRRARRARRRRSSSGWSSARAACGSGRRAPTSPRRC